MSYPERGNQGVNWVLKNKIGCSLQPNQFFEYGSRMRFSIRRDLDRRQDSQSPGAINCLGAVVDRQLAVDAAGVSLDRVDGEYQPVGDRLIGQPFGK